MAELPRLRQVALVTSDCNTGSARLVETFGWDEPFHDPGVGAFGLTNSVFAVGDTFVELVSPVKPDTTAGRYWQRRGGDSGYMAIFQVPDLTEARQRADHLGVRVVWQADLAGIAGTHLHPKDTPGAIVSLDWADPPESWSWAGPAWTGRASRRDAGGISGITVEVEDPPHAARKWAAILGIRPPLREGDALVRLEAAGQSLRFVPLADGRGPGITEVWLDGSWPEADVAGVRFRKGMPS